MIEHVIAIDGPAGSGKSSTARGVARSLGIGHLDTGALYRAVTLAALDAEVPIEGERVVAAAEAQGVNLVWVGDEVRPQVSGVDVSKAIRSGRVTGRVSEVAALPAVREWVNRRLRAVAAEHPGGVVSEGRDIGTVVFPDASLKIYLTATPEERARRRARELGIEGAGEVERLARGLAARDEADSTRSVAPLVPAKGAIHLDTTGMTLEEQVLQVAGLARKSLE
jgi:cytidylate kinase